MSRLVLLGAGACVLMIGLAAWRLHENDSTDSPLVVKTKPPEAAPQCPWREPEADLKSFFPEAIDYRLETHILSGARAELGARLGRVPTGDENLLRTFAVSSGDQFIGNIMTERVKGEYGAIEFVLATDPQGVVRGLRLQRIREPDVVEKALSAQAVSEWFIGRCSTNSWAAGSGLPPVPRAAEPSARAIVEGARSLLVRLEIATTLSREGSGTHQH